MMEAEVEVMHQQAKEHLGLPATTRSQGRSREGSSLEPSEVALSTP